MRKYSGGLRLFAVYSAVSLVTIVVIGATLNEMLGSQVDARAMSEAVSRAETIADGSIEAVLSDADLTTELTAAQRADLVRVTKTLHGDADVLRLRIRSTEGAVVFDAAHPNAPFKRFKDDEVEQAAAGRPVSEKTHLGADSLDGASATGAAAIETYVAFHGPGNKEVIGVLETYLPYAPFGDAAAEFKHRLSLALTVGLIALWAILGVVTWSVTRRLRRSAQQNDWLAHHDQLTGLPNRLSFAEQISRHFGSGEHISVAMVDIAEFRAVNDTLGHDNADHYLHSVSVALRGALPADVRMARLAGDQFGILAIDTDAASFEQILHLVAEAAAAQHVVSGITLSAEVAIGFATSNDSDLEGAALLESAELALRAAKELGASPLRYRHDFDRFDPARLALAGELGAAIAADELVLYYQPKLDLRTGEVLSVEALVRWQHPRRGLVQPDEFIPIAESTSLMRPLTEWVVQEAVRQMTEWRKMNHEIAVSVNVSARSLVDQSLPPFLLGALEASSIPPSQLKVEVTETAIVANPELGRRFLDQLHQAGVRISLDDFGQGATSLLSLANLPLDELKVDRAFVLGMVESEDQRSVVEFVISLGHRLGFTVVAEGIETEAAAEMLLSMGCDEGQGYLYSRPIPAAQFESWLIHHHSVLLAQQLSAGRPSNDRPPTSASGYGVVESTPASG